MIDCVNTKYLPFQPYIKRLFIHVTNYTLYHDTMMANYTLYQ